MEWTPEDELMYGDKQENLRAVLARLREGTMSWEQGERILGKIIEHLQDDVTYAGLGDDL